MFFLLLLCPEVAKTKRHDMGWYCRSLIGGFLGVGGGGAGLACMVKYMLRSAETAKRGRGKKRGRTAVCACTASDTLPCFSRLAFFLPVSAWLCVHSPSPWYGWLDGWMDAGVVLAVAFCAVHVSCLFLLPFPAPFLIKPHVPRGDGGPFRSTLARGSPSLIFMAFFRCSVQSI